VLGTAPNALRRQLSCIRLHSCEDVCHTHSVRFGGSTGRAACIRWRATGQRTPVHRPAATARFNIARRCRRRVDLSNDAVPGLNSSGLLLVLRYSSTVRDDTRGADVLTISIGGNNLLRFTNSETCKLRQASRAPPIHRPPSLQVSLQRAWCPGGAQHA